MLGDATVISEGEIREGRYLNEIHRTENT